MSVNKVILLGNVGQTPEVKEKEGNRWARMTLATSDRAYTKSDGTQIPERTEWHNLIVYGPMVQVVEQYVTKGMKLYIEGKLRTRSYENDGSTHYVTEVIVDKMEMLTPRQDTAPAPAPY